MSGLALQKIQLELLQRELASKNFGTFVKYTFPAYKESTFHITYANILNLFAFGIIKKLMVTVGPQHGKSELSSRRLPAFMLGLNPNLKIGIASYSTTFVRKFSVDVQRIIGAQEYFNTFPNTTIAKTKFTQESDSNFQKTKDEFEIVNYKGSLLAVGRGGPLGGNPIDLMIMDDLYKDYAEGNSPVILDNVSDWYSSVVRNRLHNDSQELIVFTRWNEEDLIGWIENKEQVILIENWDQLKPENIIQDAWYKINFPSLMNHEATEIDQRKMNTPLWPERHSLKKLEDTRNLDEEKFESLHQGDPKPKVGLLYKGFNIWSKMPDFRYLRNYTDTADTGQDYLCSICFGVGIDNMIYVLDIYYTDEPHEVTESETADMLVRNHIREVFIESNNGGRGFARNVDRLSKNKLVVNWFHQSANKESRIITNSAEVQRRILMPPNWTTRWPLFAKHLLRYKKNFKANKHDDIQDCITGVLEYSGLIESEDALWQM